ncbi:MAG: aminotransferase class I/II-fold pyridoxal phosphate-dependent enzyme [Actinomycetota bacterium]|jgi:alanine-synthesizing transaminase|nr:aminotransferase class I/II-fold pyridoxal phosphate-dependent enzyme [Actinomycetota bacterium]MDA3015913.1 aminotransferase class I/II-fold pyridoxal phosphate-dependent enzyme [Actinomycetota bacterium]MDA3028996.1 aminotransferase class I/II-fold pyridoxal phosphate-dependent enzyme [Actinomycetota bacterium]
MEFRRITNLPPYVFTVINGLKIEARQRGADVIDLGFGNPDIPSPDIAVTKLAEAARNPRNHRYSLSRGLPRLREEVAKYYKANWDVDLDPELEVTNTIGSKEGFSHLMWVLLERGDAAIVPTPSYPIHMYGPLFAGADLRQVPMRGLSHHEERSNFSEEFFDNLHRAYDLGWPKPRVLVISFPHNPTGACVDLDFMQRVVDFCREREMVVVHDFAYADIGFDGVRPPSILQAQGAKDVAVEQYSMTKSFSMAGWRSAFMVGSAEVVQALVKLKSYLDYGMFQPVQIAATVTFREVPDYPREICSIYESRCDALIDGLGKLGWDVPKPGGTMFVWAPIPEAYAEMDSVEFCSMLVRDCDVALSPGVGFGPGGEGYVRFALIENEQRISQAMRNLRRGLTRLG